MFIYHVLVTEEALQTCFKRSSFFNTEGAENEKTRLGYLLHAPGRDRKADQIALQDI